MNPMAQRYPHFKTDEQVIEMSTADSFAGGRVVFEVVTNLLKQAVTDQRTDPQSSDTARKDWRYKLAVVETMEKVLGLPAQARSIAEAAAQQRNA